MGTEVHSLLFAQYTLYLIYVYYIISTNVGMKAGKLTSIPSKNLLNSSLIHSSIQA